MYGSELILNLKEINTFTKEEVMCNSNVCVNKMEYEAFVEGHKQGGFLQSMCWSLVKEGWGCEPVVIRDEKGDIKASVMVLIKSIPFLNITYMYAPRGPVCDFSDEATLKELLTVDKKVWLEDVEDPETGIKAYFAQFGDRLPKAMADELKTLEENLKK